ncbi:hypothetical protein SAMN05192529_1101 [Arachidicoccus rhizosphaerae]|uniref:Uncharacterized protein n=1 Tax=Arachidicoccus rhizosphaerae TaxID=551991 RepID=A0A1H3Z4F7_9BACT|nr:hypothetical protein [Arachidicoccus rhizosphaerae]SEA18348.1 hypothetical protein SAMN05192529_1101 [Arachidicoccus rhizosphaerae]
MKVENIEKAKELINKISVAEGEIEAIKECYQIRLADRQNSMDYNPLNAVDISLGTDKDLNAIIEEFKCRVIDYYKDQIHDAKEELKEL